MLKRFLVAAVLILTPCAAAQEASINTPIARSSEAKYKIDYLNFFRNPIQANLVVQVQDSANVDIRAIFLAVPSTTPCVTTFGGLMTAMANAAPNETGTDARRMQFRILTYLNTQACLGTVTLVP